MGWMVVLSEAETGTRHSGGALDGIRVLEFGMVMQVPLAAQMLGDYGADVIKIERPSGDIMRHLDTELEETDGRGTFYTAVGRNKRVVGLDVKSQMGREAILRLIDSADVLLHNFRPGVMEKLGLGYEDLARRNPGLVYAVGYGFGKEGPMAALPGQDLLAQSFSGFAMSGVEKGETPRFSNSPVIDYTTAVTLTQGIMAALIERQRSGQGQLVTTSLLDVALNTQMTEVAGWAVRGVRASWLRQSMLFETADGWMMVLTLFRDNPLQLLCKAFGVDDLSTQIDFITREQQVERLEVIRAGFAPLFRSRTTAECARLLTEVDILFSPVHGVEQCIASDQIEQNDVLWDVQVSDTRTERLAGNPVKLSRTPPALSRQPATVGAHTDEVLAELGFGADEVAAMRGSGAAF